jgi:hypothetical protein
MKAQIINSLKIALAIVAGLIIMAFAPALLFWALGGSM